MRLPRAELWRDFDEWIGWDREGFGDTVKRMLDSMGIEFIRAFIEYRRVYTDLAQDAHDRTRKAG